MLFGAAPGGRCSLSRVRLVVESKYLSRDRALFHISPFTSYNTLLLHCSSVSPDKPLSPALTKSQHVSSLSHRKAHSARTDTHTPKILFNLIRGEVQYNTTHVGMSNNSSHTTTIHQLIGRRSW